MARIGWRFKACRRCHGDVYRDGYGDVWCLQCGYYEEISPFISLIGSPPLDPVRRQPTRELAELFL